MIRNYLITAFRNISRQKGYSLIIILGLTISITVFALILLYVNNEYQTDRFNKHYKDIYRLETEDWAILGTAYGPELAANFPEIEDFTRISGFEGASLTVKKDEKLIKLQNMLYADSAMLNIFTFEFLQGNPNTALKVPFSVILTQSEAKRLFGDDNPLGQSLQINNKHNFTVTGVIKDVPRFHIKTNAIAYFPTLQHIYNDSTFLNRYGQWNYHTFFRLKPNTDPKLLANKIIQFYTGKANWVDSKPFFQLRPLKEIYFTQVKYNIGNPGGNKSMLIFFMSIGVFIVVIACVNFINLTTARAGNRSKEIGVRKVLGAGKSSLILQFLGEAILITIISTELALVLIELLRPVANNLLNREITYGDEISIWLLIIAVPFPILIGIIAGLYPAFYLNRLKPVSSLKKEKTSGKGSLIFRRVLITFQFSISIFLIIATLTVYKQLNYFRSKDLGFDKDQVLVVGLNEQLLKNRETFRQKLLSDANISSVAFSTQPFGNISWQESVMVDNENKQFTFLGTEPEFIGTLNLQVIQGRNFDRSNPTDQEKVIINEEAVKYFGLKNPIGAIIGTGDRKMEVLGVIKDCYYNSLHSPVAPLVIAWRPQYTGTASILINGSAQQTTDHIRKVWNEISGDFILEYKFLDESFDNLYKSEVKLAHLFMYMAILAIFIAAIGLLGLASYLAEQRTKEIGVRKVLGASEMSILKLLSGEFVKWVILAGIIAIPLAWYIMNVWLSQFAYHTSIDIYILLVACFTAIVITIATVSYQAYRAAHRNPVEALRYE